MDTHQTLWHPEPESLFVLDSLGFVVNYLFTPPPFSVINVFILLSICSVLLIIWVLGIIQVIGHECVCVCVSVCLCVCVCTPV